MELITTEEQKLRQKLFRIIQEKLYISDKDMEAKKARASSLNERLHNEINLVSISFQLVMNSFKVVKIFC